MPFAIHESSSLVLSDIREMEAVQMIPGTLVLTKANVLGLNKMNAAILDRADEIAGKGVTLRLVGGRNGRPAYVQNLNKKMNDEGSEFAVTFEWEEDMGVPEAFIIRNDHNTEFFLMSLTIQNFPTVGRLHFACNSWVYPAHRYENDRVFFRNKSYLPHQTPPPLMPFRAQELRASRGTRMGMLHEWDRVYDYDVYNDLADPTKGPKYNRPVLGGTPDHPYPRRGRTGRPPVNADPHYESRLPVTDSLNIYVPRDERFSQLRMSDFLGYGIKSIAQVTLSAVAGIDSTPKEFDSFDNIYDLYEGGSSFLSNAAAQKVKNSKAFELLKEMVRSDGEKPGKFPIPSIIKNDKSAWRADEEFAREMIAGLNPNVIKLLEEFPIKSKLDPAVYGHQDSTITAQHVEKSLDGMTMGTALAKKRMFILDYHDALIPYVRRINKTSAKIYATRTLLFLKEDGTLKPVAIELSLPSPKGDYDGAVSEVYMPAKEGADGTIWQLAKAYVAVNDSGYHQLISHWLHTHAVVEPFVIATHRQLSALHPIHKLLHPHFRDTMHINALGRQLLISAGGLMELTLFPEQYAMELSSELYKSWKFTDHALPNELKCRGMAVDDPQTKSGVRLLIEDYPYAVDGLEIWCAIHHWVEDYCGVYYETDEMVKDDVELAMWWKEIREVGHGDKANEKWWPKMETRGELIESCTTLIWMSSALHAAVNFGMYPYAGFLPNRPTISRRLMPVKGSPEYKDMKANPERAFLKTITAEFQTLMGISLIEVLSRHAADEVYIGERETAEWTAEEEALKAFERFGKRLREIEDGINEMNNDCTLKNRAGAAKVPYTLLIPTSTQGLTGRGIPNSISI